jgi:hypothetical protein
MMRSPRTVHPKRYLAHNKASLLIALALCLAGAASIADEPGAPAGREAEVRQYTFAWPFVPGDAMAPRGGMTSGAPVTLLDAPAREWLDLRADNLSPDERDRRAILAMAGPFRTTFDFIETVGFTAGYAPSAPYQSWGTEFVYVIADTPGFISLQHILVMRLADVSEPVVVKHWRQDWHFERRELDTFRGHSTWARTRLDPGDVRGRWLQTVWQVDDSPRYQAVGQWRHLANASSWQSDETWRPLPRREFSVRDDYDVLIGTNRHTILPSGWAQEEDNLKVVLDDRGEVTAVLAREVGVARYERITAFDWSAGDDYWQRTAPFWAIVRDVWQQVLDRGRVVMNADQGEPLFATLFALAEREAGDEFDAERARQEVQAALARHLRK